MTYLPTLDRDPAFRRIQMPIDIDQAMALALTSLVMTAVDKVRSLRFQDFLHDQLCRHTYQLTQGFRPIFLTTQLLEKGLRLVASLFAGKYYSHNGVVSFRPIVAHW